MKMKPISVLLIAAAAGIGAYATYALAQQSDAKQTETKADAAPAHKQASEKAGVAKTEKAYKDSANARAAVKAEKKGKELEEETRPQ